MSTHIHTIADLINTYPQAKARNKMATAFRKLGPETLNQSPQVLWAELDERLQALNRIENRKSRSAHKAQIVKCLRHGCDLRIIAIGQNTESDTRDFPPYEEFAEGNQKNQFALKTSWNAFERFAESRKLSMESITLRHMDDFREWLKDQVFDHRRTWNLFAIQWELAAARRIIPSLGLLPYPSNQPVQYALKAQNLPQHLKLELEEATARQMQQGLGSRFRNRPIAKSTVGLRTVIVLRYLGFLVESGNDLSALRSIGEAFTRDRVFSYLEFTNTADSPDDMGVYQQSILVNLEQFLRHGLLNADKAEMLKDIWSFHSDSFFVRREIAKQSLYLDDLYRIVAVLLERSAAAELPLRDRVLCVRDAVIFLLLASFAFRREIVLNLRLGSTFIKSSAGIKTCYLVEVAKEITKPKLRDGYYEVLDQYFYLIDYYCCQVRPYLLNGKPDDRYLLRSQSGTKLGSQSIYSVVRRRSLDILGREINPHMARKALATEWLRNNPKDLLTLSLIMDCSVNTIQTSYAQPRPMDACRQFDQRAAQKIHTDSTRFNLEANK